MKRFQQASINVVNGQALEFYAKNDIARPLTDQFKDLFPLVVINGTAYKTQAVVAQKVNTPFLPPGCPIKISVSEYIDGVEMKKVVIKELNKQPDAFDFFTGQMRYIQRVVGNETKLVLQQKWMNDLCDIMWKDIPIVKEGE